MRHKLGLLLLLAGFLAAGGWLVMLLFGTGDQAPAYSTLRADPLGTRALADAFERAGLEVEPYCRPLPPVGTDLPPATRFFIGLPYSAVLHDPTLAPRLRALAEQGSRVIVAFHPVIGNIIPPVDTVAVSADTAGPDDTSARELTFGDTLSEADSRALAARQGDTVALARLRRHWAAIRHAESWRTPPQWDCALASDTAPSGDSLAFRLASADSRLTATLRWHSRLHFRRLGSAWRVHYRHNRLPVVISRRCGRGELILIADSYFLSNEALQQARPVAALAWLAGASRQVFFHEEHLGLHDERGLITLARTYDLTGGLLLLLIFTLLCLWRAAASFVPPPPDDALPAVSERRSEGGEGALLQRHLPRRGLLRACFTAWQASQPRHLTLPDNTRTAVTQLLAAAETTSRGRRDLIGLYRELRRLLGARR